MSVQALSWAMGQQVGDTGAKLVLWALANYADDNGLSWPNVKTLMRAAECSRATLFRKLDHLEELGLLEREQRHDDVGRQRSSYYRLQMAQVELELKASGVGSQIETPGSQAETGRVSPVRRGGSQIETERVSRVRPLEPSLELTTELPTEEEPRASAPSPPTEVHVDDELDLGPRLVELDDRMPDLRPKEQQLRDHLGSHADVVDLLSLRLSSELWCASVWGWYGPDGVYTDLDMAPVPAASRGDALAAALYAVLQELDDDARGIHQKFLRSCVRTVVDERWRQKRPFFTKDEEDRREAARKAVFRDCGDPEEISSILRGPSPPPPVVERGEGAIERQLREDREWFDALSPERQAAVRLSAQTRAIDRFGHVPSGALIRELMLNDEIRETRKVEAEAAAHPAPEPAERPESRREALKRQVEAVARTA